MPKSNGLPPGTLILLILRVVRPGPLNGYAIAQRIRALSSDQLSVEEGSLYPALHRLELNGDVTSEMTASENNRRARYYTLTATGRKQLEAETRGFTRMIGAIVCGPWNLPKSTESSSTQASSTGTRNRP